MTKTTSRSATHSGHCQCCGRLQKLPGDVLSKHGYTVEHGFFSGVCRGAGYKPFEVSCDQVVRYIAEAEAHVAHLEAWITELTTPATENRAWVRNYEGLMRPSYVWRQVEIIATPSTIAGSTHVSFSYMAPGTRGRDNVSHRIEGYSVDYAKTTLEAVTKLNEAKARSVAAEVVQMRRYIAWQQERVSSWTPAPLLPVNAKDKQGFEVAR